MHRTRGRLASPTAYLTASILHSILLSCSLPVLEVSFSPVPYYNLPRCTSPPVSHSATTFRYSRSRNASAHPPAAQRSASPSGTWAVRRSASCSQRPSVPRKYASPARNHPGPVPRYLRKIAGRRLAARRGGAARSFAQVPASPGESRQCHTPRVSKRGLREGPSPLGPPRSRRGVDGARVGVGSVKLAKSLHGRCSLAPTAHEHGPTSILEFCRDRNCGPWRSLEGV